METTLALTMGTGRAQWWPYQLHDGRRSAVLRCPKCGLPSFVTEHSIDDAGNLDGRFACRGSACGFEAWLALEGWYDGAAGPAPRPSAPSP